MTEICRELAEEVLACAALLRRGERVAGRSPQLSLSQQAVLRFVQAHPGLTVPQLARRRGNSRQNIQGLVDRLVQAGLLEPAANPDHRRSACLQLTEAGRRRLGRAARAGLPGLSELAATVAEEDLRTGLGLLRSLRTRLGGDQAEIPGTPARRRRRVAEGGPQPEPPSAAPPADEIVTPPTETVPTEELPVSLL